jgi:hypothetical protein
MIVCLLASGVFAASTPGASAKATHAAASPSASAAPTASAAQLSSTEKAQAIKTDSVTIPTPGELFAALGKPGKPDWAGRYRGPIAMNYKTRPQIALNIGGLIADGFIAVEAQDTQQVKNIGGDIVKMAKALGASESILSRGNSINQFAENDEWSTLQEELEATQNEVKASMQSHRDQDLVILVSLGGWIRGAQVVSGVVAKNYDEKLGQVLRQPELLAWFIGPSRRVIFDETHLGVEESPGISALARKYRLHGLFGALLALALLFVWKNSTSFLPPYEEEVRRDGGDAVAGRESSAGFVNLLRRNIRPDDLLGVCITEWRTSCARQHSRTRLERIQAVIDAENVLPPKKRNPIQTWQAISRILQKSSGSRVPSSEFKDARQGSSSGIHNDNKEEMTTNG